MRLFIALALYTGARAGAILDLKWEQVDINAVSSLWVEAEAGSDGRPCQ